MPGDNAAEAGAAIDALRIAMLTADRPALERLTDDELVYGHTSGRTETKLQFIEGLVSGKSGYSEIVVTSQSIKIIDDVAVVHQTWDAVRNNAPPGARLKLAALSVWLRRSGHWKLVARQAVK